MNSKQYYIELAERYFDAETSVAEERELREFLATTSDTDFDEVKMVMGFFALTKTRNSAESVENVENVERVESVERGKEGLRTKTKTFTMAVAAAAAVLLLIVAVPFLTKENSDCLMIAEGETTTNHELVMEEMDKEMAMLFSTDEEESMESEMALILN